MLTLSQVVVWEVKGSSLIWVVVLGSEYTLWEEECHVGDRQVLDKHNSNPPLDSQLWSNCYH